MKSVQFLKSCATAITLIISACIHPSVQAELLWDSVGSPDSSAFNVYDDGGYLQFDTPEPGTMYYNTLNHTGEIGSGSGYIWMRPDLANTELSYLAGWSWEARVYVVQNVKKPGLSWKEYCGACIDACDGVRDTCVFLRPDRIDIEGSNPGIPTLGSYQYDLPGYHTIRFEAIPNPHHVNVFVDGENRISVDYSTAPEHPVKFSFGDPSSNSDGEAYWDYVAVNTAVPEPGSVIMLAGIALTALLYWVRKRA